MHSCPANVRLVTVLCRMLTDLPRSDPASGVLHSYRAKVVFLSTEVSAVWRAWLHFYLKLSYMSFSFSKKAILSTCQCEAQSPPGPLSTLSSSLPISWQPKEEGGAQGSPCGASGDSVRQTESLFAPVAAPHLSGINLLQFQQQHDARACCGAQMEPHHLPPSQLN